MKKPNFNLGDKVIVTYAKHPKDTTPTGWKITPGECEGVVLATNKQYITVRFAIDERPFEDNNSWWKPIDGGLVEVVVIDQEAMQDLRYNAKITDIQPKKAVRPKKAVAA